MRKGKVTDGWQERADRLEELLKTEDPNRFLDWDVIRKGMVIGNPAFILQQLRELRLRPDWDRWAEAIREVDTGSPRPCSFYPKSTGTLIRHAYYLMQMEQTVGAQIDEFDFVFEFGGGYGSMCRLFHNLGFRGQYLIYDLPPFCKLQDYFLGTIGVSALSISDFDVLEKTIAQSSSRRAAFVATWSLSETPLLMRDKIFALIDRFSAFLITYQRQFHEIDNVACFHAWTDSRPEVDWREWEIELGANCLIGAS